ncbi:MAG: ATP-binding protein [Sideroxydans sp.]|nr:ATP-binding protein [Sideroxydans sp.]
MIHILHKASRPADIRRHLFRDVGIIAVAALLIVGSTLVWVADDEYRQTQESEYRLLEAHARNADTQIADTLDSINHLLGHLAQERLRNRLQSGNAFAVELGRHWKDIPETGTIFVADAAGRIQSTTDAVLSGWDVSRAPFFTVQRDQARKTRLFVSRPYKYFPGAATVVFSLPVVDAKHKFAGIVGLTAGFAFFPRILQTINPDDSASMSVIFNHDGDLLYRRSEPEKYFGTNIVTVSTVFREHLSSGGSVTRHIAPSAFDGKPRLFLVRDVGDSGLGLILSRRMSEVLAVWKRNVAIYALIFLFSLVVVISLAIAAARRKQSEDAQIESLNRLKKIAGQVPGVVFQFRLHPDGHFSIPFASEAIQEIFQVSPQQVREDASKAISIIHPDDYPAVIAHIRQSAKELSPWQQEFRVKFADGTVHWMFGNALPQQEADGCVLWHGFITNISERKRMEGDLVAAKRQAESANLAKSRFLAAASHDLRQPIHAQGLFLGVLARTELNAYQREVLANATAASRSSVEMLNTLLDFSRIEAGVIKPKVQAFYMQPLLNKIEREFEQQADAKGLAYRSRETAIAVQSDPMLVELILRNLVSNAIRYTVRGGLLVTCRKRGEHAVLEVWDTGIGITPEHQREVFQEFHQLGNPERDRQKGLGLGLAIAEGLARTLVHELTLVSTPQRGSVFRLTLPIASEAPVATSGTTQHKNQKLNARVLVIDDDEAVRSGMRHLLRNWGCECETAESIEEALALARIHAPDVVISDYRLREQRTGLEAIAALRGLLGNALPALLLTGDTAPDTLREAQTSGIALLHKPVSPGKLYRGLVAAIETK